jgi:hypothetical protein
MLGGRAVVRLALVLLALTGLAATCGEPSRDITAERAIEIAKAQATFPVDTVRADRTTEQGRPVWRVTLRGRPAGPDMPELRPILIVDVDRRSGEIVSLSKS